MTDIALPGSIEPARKGPDLSGAINPITGIILGGIVAAVLLFVAYSIYSDVDAAGTKVTNYLPFLLLFVALLIALGFEFVNGFHDTANAVATVIYTRSLPANIAVVWSGVWNLAGVLASSGAVAFGIISLLPVELILQVGSHAGFAMVFALLIAAIIWNLGTWSFGLPASSSHTLIGSIIGVGIANALLHGRGGTSGVDWGKAKEVGEALLLSPMFGFALAAALLLLLKSIVRIPALYAEPKGEQPPPWWIRGILILTCTAGQLLPRLQRWAEGHGPDHADPDRHGADGLCTQSRAAGEPSAEVRRQLRRPRAPSSSKRRQGITSSAIRARRDRLRRQPYLNEGTYPSLAALVRNIAAQVNQYGSLARMPAEAVGNARNDMYLASEAIRFLMKDKASELSPDEVKTLNTTSIRSIRRRSSFPTGSRSRWRSRSGSGTMVGWKRIVITVGEKIGKTHLTYAQGACAEITAARPSPPPTFMACRSRRRTSCPPASPAPWPRTARDCSLLPCAISPWRGCSRCRRR